MEARTLKPINNTTRSHASTYPSSSYPSLSLVIPAYNEEACIENAINEATEALDGLHIDYELLVVDDGSSDATASIVQRLQETHARLRLLKQGRNQGYGAALRRGFQEATKECTAFTDADCQFDLKEIKLLLEKISTNDVVCGIRVKRQDPLRRLIYSRTYNHIVRLLLGTQVRDCDCALKVFRTSILRDLTISTDGFLVNADLLSQIRAKELRIAEVGVTHRPRIAGESKVSIFHVLPVLIHLVRFWWSNVVFPSSLTEVSESRTRWSPKQRLGMGIVLALISGAMFFTNIGYPLVEPDESRYAQIALEMLQSKNWIMPTLHTFPYLDKPPMLYWVTATSYQCFGATPWATRFPIALASWLTVMGTYVLGAKLLGDRTAWIGALMTLFCTGYIVASRFLIMDGLLTFGTLGCYLSIVRALHSRTSMGWWVLAGVFASLGILTKGPIAIILCIPPAIACTWLSNRIANRKWLGFTAFCTVCTVLSLPWFLLVAKQQHEFAGYFLWKHNVVRFFNAFNHQEPFWYYIPILIVGLFPLTLLVPIAFAYFTDRRETTRQNRISELGFVAIGGAWVVLFFSISSCKLPTYVVPSIPLIAMTFGYVFDEVVFGKRCRDWMSNMLAACSRGVVWLSIPGIVLIVCMDSWFADRFTLPGITMLAIAACAVAVWKWKLKESEAWMERPWQFAAMACFVVGPYGIWQTYPQFATWRSSMQRLAKVEDLQKEEVPVVFLGRVGDGADLVIDSQWQFMGSDEIPRFLKFVDQSDKVLILASNQAIAELQTQAPSNLVLRSSFVDDNIYTVERLTKVAERKEAEAVDR